MNLQPQKIIGIIVAAVLLSGCSMPSRPTATPIVNQALAGTIVAATLSAIQTRSPANTAVVTDGPALQATDAASPEPSTTASPVPTITVTPTITPTFSTPQLSFDSSINCREGPGTDYKVVTVITAEQKVEPVGQQNNYWLVKNPNNSKSTCWVINDFATPSGSTWTITTVTAPAPPTVQAPATPSWSKWNYRCDYAANGFSVTMVMSWSDLANNLTGYKVYRDDQVIATLGPDTTSYTDTTPLDNGKSLTYYIEALKDTATSRTSTINAACQ